MVALAALVGGFTFGSVSGLVASSYIRSTADQSGGVAGVFAFAPAIAMSAALVMALTTTAWGAWLLICRIWLPLTGELPWRLLSFLDEANERGILRRAGPAYEFRHIRLQQYLAASIRK